MVTPNEADKVLEMRIRSMAYASDIQNAIAAYREEIETKIRTRHQEYEKTIDRRWSEAIAKHEAEVTALRSQLARKDEGMREAQSILVDALVCDNPPEYELPDRRMSRVKWRDRAHKLIAALREPDGRKGE